MTQSLCQIPAGTPVLITGATGFTGSLLTRKLVTAGLKVSALARDSSDISPFEDLPITWFRGDVYDESVLAEALKGQEYVFHIAAAFREAKSTEDDYRNVQVRSTQIIAQIAAKSQEFKRLILVSTVGVHGHIEHPPATEETAFHPGDDYQKTKLEAELWLRDFAPEHDLGYTIIRPAGIYGPGDRRLLKLFKMAKMPIVPLLGYGKCLFHLIHVDDLTNAIILSATAPEAHGEAFIIGSTEPISIAEMIRIISRHIGSNSRIIRFPITPFFVMGDICECICRPFRIEPPIYRRRVAFFSKDRHFDVSKMRNILKYEPIHSNQEGLIQTADWYTSNGWL